MQQNIITIVWQRLEKLAENLMNEEHEFVLAAAEITHRAMEDCEIIERLFAEECIPQELVSPLATQCKALGNELEDKDNFKITPREEIAALVNALVEKLEQLVRLLRSGRERK